MSAKKSENYGIIMIEGAKLSILLKTSDDVKRVSRMILLLLLFFFFPFFYPFKSDLPSVMKMLCTNQSSSMLYRLNGFSGKVDSDETGKEIPRNIRISRIFSIEKKKMKNYPIEMDQKPKMKTDLFKRNENSIECDV